MGKPADNLQKIQQTCEDDQQACKAVDNGVGQDWCPDGVCLLVGPALPSLPSLSQGHIPTVPTVLTLEDFRFGGG